MATLFGKWASNTYKDILKIASASDQAGIDATLRTVEDGDATASALQISTLGVKSLGTLQVTGVSTLAAVTATSGDFSYIVTRGALPSGTGANTGVSDFSGGTHRLFSYGADVSTKGAFTFLQQSSDGSLQNTPIEVQAGGNVLLAQTIGSVGIGIAPTAFLTLKAGTAAANSAPLKITSGALNTTAEVGAVEFLTDAYYGTITTGAARKTFAFLESPTFTGTVTAPTIISTAVVRLKGYTVATLPAGTQGGTAFVTDATTPTYNAALVGGGAVVVPVFYNGTAWVSA